MTTITTHHHSNKAESEEESGEMTQRFLLKWINATFNADFASIGSAIRNESDDDDDDDGVVEARRKLANLTFGYDFEGDARMTCEEAYYEFVTSQKPPLPPLADEETTTISSRVLATVESRRRYASAISQRYVEEIDRLREEKAKLEKFVATEFSALHAWMAARSDDALPDMPRTHSSPTT